LNQVDEHGLKTGPWEERDPHGGVVAGSYVAGERQGEWLHHFADGRVRSEFHYDAGKLTAGCTWYRATGGLAQKGGFLHDQKHGCWQRWTATDSLLDEGSFDRGTKVGEWMVSDHDSTVKKRTNYRA